MAQTGYTPIQLYYSTTASAVPTSGNLANGELAINITDGKLYYKNNSGTVTVLAGAGGTGIVAGSNTQLQFNNSGVFGASSSLTWDGTYLTAGSIKDSALTSGRVTFAGASGLLTDDADLTFDGTTLSTAGLTASGTVTLSGGTANGVAYLNGSKVLTTGSALTYDAETLANDTGSSGGTTGFSASNSVALGYTALTLRNTGASGKTYEVGMGGNGTSGNYQNNFYIRDTTGNPLLYLNSASTFVANAFNNVRAAGLDTYINHLTTGINNTVIGFNNSGSTNSSGVLNNTAYIGSLNTYSTSVVGNGATIATFVSSAQGAQGISVNGVVNITQTGYFPTTGFTHNTNGYLYALGGTNGFITQVGGSNVTTTTASGFSITNSLFFSAGTLFGAGNVGFSYRSSDSTLYLQTPTGGFNITDNALNTKVSINSTAFTTYYDAVINGVTVGRGAGAVSTNTAVGALTIGISSGGVSGTNNTAFGYATLSSLTSGTSNTGSGWAALNAINSGSYNTASGAGALQNNTSGSNNIAIGYQAGYLNQTGTTNVFIGLQAGYTSNHNSPNGNTCVGAYAGYALTTGVANTFIGSTRPGSGIASGLLVTEGNGNTIVGNFTGNQGGLDIRTASNNIVLSDGDGNPRLYCDSSGNWTNPGTLNVNDYLIAGNAVTYKQYNQSFSVGTTQWIRLCGLGNPGTMRIRYFLGSSNSEEYGEVYINTTYVAAQEQITVTRQSYNSHLQEVRLVSSNGQPNVVYFLIRSDTLAPSIAWTAFDVRSNNGLTIYNDTTTPGAATASLVLETGSGTSSNITATNGLFGAYGGGVQFPSTQVASSNANTLDDYEEGTWTPALYYQNATGVTRTYTTQDGGYTKIGNTVTIWCVLKGATSNSGSYANDNIGISGLPFVAGAVGDSFAFATVGQGGFTGSSSVGPVGAQLSGVVGVFLQLADVSTGNLGNDLGSATAYTIYVSGTYRI